MLIEVAGGLIAGSLALLADGGHMVSDAAALGMSWLAIRVGKTPADETRSYGYQRLEVLAAFLNGCTLFLIAAWIVFEAIRRFASPVHILGSTMLAVAVAGLLANVVAFIVLNGGNRAQTSICEAPGFTSSATYWDSSSRSPPLGSSSGPAGRPLTRFCPL